MSSLSVARGNSTAVTGRRRSPRKNVSPNCRFVRSLTPAERTAVETIARNHSRSRVRTRAMAIGLSADGFTALEIADRLDVRPQSVRLWITAFDRKGLDALKDRPNPGAPPKAGPGFRRLLRATALKSPTKFGYPFAAWNAVRLWRHLTEVSGVRISAERVRQLLRAEGLSFARTGL